MIIATDFNPTEALNISHRKEKKFTKEIAVIDPEAKEAVAVARFYETNTRFYVCFWAWRLTAGTCHGSAYADGGGYHMESAALQSALEAAGFKFNQHWGGAGSYAMKEALLNSMKFATGNESLFLHTAHG